MMNVIDRRRQHPYFRHGRRPRVLAHRGFVPAAGDAEVVENTRAAIAAAVELGADYIETDCHLTSDGHVVLFHDRDLTRLFGDRRRIAEMRVSELQSMMADRGGLLLLRDMFEEFPDSKFNIDVKAPAAAEPMGEIVAPHSARVLLTSFSDEYRARALQATIAAGAKTPPATSPGRRVLMRLLLDVASRSRSRISRTLSELDALQIPERQGLVKVLSKRLLDVAHQHGVEVHVWTVNDPLTMERLVRSGIDGIVTDRADVALDVLEPLRRPTSPRD